MLGAVMRGGEKGGVRGTRPLLLEEVDSSFGAERWIFWWRVEGHSNLEQ